MPGQTRAGIGRSNIVVVVVEVGGGVNYAKTRICRKVVWCAGLVMNRESSPRHVPELCMVEDIKRLYAELEGEPFGEWRVLHQG